MQSTDNLSFNQEIRQWISKILNISPAHYKDSLRDMNLIGPPKIFPNYGDFSEVLVDKNDFEAKYFIDLEFPQELYVDKLNIYETYHSGSIIRIKFLNKKLNIWNTVWQSNTGALDIQQSRLFSPDLKKVVFKTNQIRVELDGTVANTYSQLDAIEMIGRKHIVGCIKSENNLGNNLKKLLDDGNYSDVQFEVNGHILRAHRNILISRSDYFRTLLCDNLRPDRLSKPVHLTNITVDGFKALLHYFYTNKIEDNTSIETCCELNRLSDWYEIPKLKDQTFFYCRQIMNLENVGELYILATNKEPKLEKIENICIKFISKNYPILHEQELKRLPKELLIQCS